MRGMKSAVLWIAAAAIVVAAGSLGARASDLAAMQPPEIEALQKRLADDGCYKGPIDGQASQATQDSIKACPDQDPVLRIETGMHVAKIGSIGVDAACTLLATGSNDKTLRLWSLPEGRLIHTVRLAIGPGNGGQIRAVALSPDGKTLAAGGWDATDDRDTSMGNGLYLVDLASGGVRRLGAYEDVITHIAFSADGTRIGVGLGSNNGIRVLDSASARELLADRHYGNGVYGLAFAPDGSLVTTSVDGFLRRYRPDLKLTAKVKAPGGALPYGIAVSPDGRRAVVGYADTAVVSILDTATLKLVVKARPGDVANDDLHNVAWTVGGQAVAGGQAQETIAGKPYQVFLRRFSPDGKRIGTDIAAADDAISDLKPCGSGIAFAAQDPRFGLLDAEGKARTLQGPVTADLRGKLGDAFTVSDDAATVHFGLDYGKDHPVLFNLAAGTLAAAPNPPAGLHPALIDGLPITDWNGTTAPKLGGTPIPIEQHEASESLAIRPDRAGFVLGADFYLRGFDAQGQERWRQPAPGVAGGVNLNADGTIVVAAYRDGTIRWHRWSDGQELLALFVDAKDQRWVAWTPTGYYMASPGAEDLIGWHVNRGWEQLADFFPASRFRDKFNRPDIVRLVLKTLDESEAIKQADAAAHKHDQAKPLIESLPPVVTITSPAEGVNVPSGPLEIRYNVRLPSGGTLDHVEAFVDGAKIETRGLARADAGLDGSVTVAMPAHDAVISLVAYANGKASDAVRLDLKGNAPAAEAASSDDALKPSLYALLVGVTHYENKSYDLGYAAADADGLAEALKAQEGRLYRHVEVKVLTDKEATATEVKKGLIWLQHQTTARDLALVFASGHGMTDAKGKFWFLTEDADPDALLASAVSQDDISSILFDLPGKKLVFLDACHSGAALNEGTRGLERTDASAAVNDFAQAEGGVVAYAASTGKEFSLERPEWGHGAFTKALIEGIDGKADLLHKGTITTATLDAYLEDRVKELTGGAQHPVMTRPKTVPDFPIAVVN